jgi:toxin ParE1/3/4
MAHRVSDEAQAELDDIWYYVAKESGSEKIADRLIDQITRRFFMLAQHPHMGRKRDEDLRPGLRTFHVGSYIIVYRVEGNDVLILLAVRGDRDLAALLDEIWPSPT